MTLPAEAERRPPRHERPSLMRLSRRVASRLERGIRRVPPALAALVVVVAILGVGWALLVPPWQSPDENNHFAYAQSLAERGALPQASGRPGWSSDQGVADYWSNASPTAWTVLPNAWRRSKPR